MRLLLVEDDESLAGALRAHLAQAGYAVDVADNGIDAEHLGDEIDYDLVILDLGLPGRPGLDVLRAWRAHGRRMPVIILTARDAWQERVTGFKTGADDYVGKPFHVEELLARVHAVAQRSHLHSNGPLQAGGLVLDEDTQSVVDAGGVRHALTGTEFRLLRYFMHNPGILLSRSRLTDAVYELDADKDSNVIEVYVNRLRRKLGRDVIHTRRGQGYLFGERRP